MSSFSPFIISLIQPTLLSCLLLRLLGWLLVSHRLFRLSALDRCIATMELIVKRKHTALILNNLNHRLVLGHLLLHLAQLLEHVGRIASLDKLIGVCLNLSLSLLNLSVYLLYSKLILLNSLLVLGKMVPSKSEGRRAIEQGGVSIDGEKVTDVRALITKDQLSNGILVKRGKKSFNKFLLK